MVEKKTPEKKINDYLILFFQVLITVLLVIVPVVMLGLDKHYWLVAIAFVLVFYLVQCSLSNDVFNRAFAGGFEGMIADGDARRLTTNNFPVGQSGVLVEDGVFGDVSENYYGTRMPIMGPFDGVQPRDLKKQISTSYQKTAYPYRPLTNYNVDVSLDSGRNELLPVSDNDLKKMPGYYQQDVERWYPNMSGKVYNTRDCTNWAAGHPASCLQSPERVPSSPVALSNITGVSAGSQLLDAELSKKEEKFNDIASTPKLLKSGEPFPMLFKNAPGKVEFDTEELHPKSSAETSTKCRTCKTGICLGAYCGSRLVEPGNNNIINPAAYMVDYLKSVALV